MVRAGAAIAMAALLSVLLVRILVFPANVYATVETLDGPLYRVSEGERHPINVGDRIDAGKVLRTDTSSEAVLALSDGSRVEMRQDTELSVERAKDGVQIRLNEGSVLVIPAEKPKSALYVQSAEGTQPVTAMVFQSVPASTSTGAKAAGGTEQPRLRFEAVSLRPVSQTPTAGSVDRLFRCRGVDGVFHASTGTLTNLATLAAELGALPPSAVPLGRCVGQVHPRQLIAQAYNIPHPPMQVSTSFDWPEAYQIEAKAPDPASVTMAQLREMLQTLLAERYAFKMHLESREGPGCVLRVAKNGPKFKATSGEETIEPPRLPTGPEPLTFKGKFRMKTFASSLWQLAGRVSVIDETGLPGVYDLTFRIVRTIVVAVEAEETAEEEAAELTRDLAQTFPRCSRINSASCCRAQKFRPTTWWSNTSRSPRKTNRTGPRSLWSLSSDPP
jgi:uncharacterized protein (TIGR03435 family)